MPHQLVPQNDYKMLSALY